MTAPGDQVHAAVDAAYRDEWGQVVATLIGLMWDWDLAEDCAQEAFAAALTSWPRDGVPRRPGAWLTATARTCCAGPAVPARRGTRTRRPESWHRPRPSAAT